MRMSVFRFSGAAALCLVVPGCGGDSTAPVKPASVAAASTGSITGTVGLPLTSPPQFVVRDASGNALSNIAVTVAVTAGGGTLSGAPTKSSAGGTPVGSWTLGTTAGANTLTITAGGLPPLTINATGTAGVPTQLTVASGSAQSGPAAGLLPQPLVFKVGDQFNNGVAGVTVSFSVTAGGGSLAGGSGVSVGSAVADAITDAAGLAPAPAWTLGKSTNSQQLRAQAGSLLTTATASVASNYKIEIRYFGPPVDASIQAAFTAAAERIQGMVTGDVPDQPLTSFSVSGCGITGVGPLTETVDDLIVYANVAPIDGVGKIFGSAGVCFTRTGGLALIGVINFDVADLQKIQAENQLGDVVLHEMLHTLGVGTLWASKFLVSGSGTSNSVFTGVQAVSGCQFHGGGMNCTTTVPLETTGSVGTRDVHWREKTSGSGFGFDTELMTGFIEAPGIPMPLSRMTIGSLADLGYVVNQAPYDAYSVASALVAGFSAIREAQGNGKIELNDAVREPIGTVDRAGRVTLIKLRR